MGVYSDPSATYNNPTTWSGSEQDDTLVYINGSDVIIGNGGYDVLVIPFRKSDAIIGVYQNNSVSFSFRYRYFESINEDIGWRTINVSTVGVEQLQFSDEVVTLAEREVPQEPVTPVTPVATGDQITIPWGRGGYWTRNKRLGARKGWMWKGAEKSPKYHIDNDVQIYSSDDIGTSPLALSGGSWANTQRQAAWEGTILYSGNNVIAFFEDWSVAQFDAATKI